VHRDQIKKGGQALIKPPPRAMFRPCSNLDELMRRFAGAQSRPLGLFALLFSLLLASVSLAQSSASQLKPGDIVYTDSGDAVHGGFIIKVDPATGEKSVVSSGAYLQNPFGALIETTSQIIVSDSGRLLAVDPVNGAQRIICDNTRGPLGFPYGIAFSRSGDLVVANLQAIIEVEPSSGQIQLLSAGGHFGFPLGVVVANNGQLFVLNIAPRIQILRVNPLNGTQRVLTQGGLLKNPQSMAISGNDIYVTDVASPNGNFGIGRVIHFDAHSGAQSVVAEAGNLVGPVGIAFDAAGYLIVADPYTINTNSPALYDGGIIRIDPETGQQTLLTRGEGSIVNPRGVAVMGVTRRGPRGHR